MLTEELRSEVARLKSERDAVVLAHYYVNPEVQELADHVGDSFALARLATTLSASTLVFAGVSFMAESAKLLSPNKTVLMPDPAADCPMAHMVLRKTVDAARERYGDDLAVACYVNSTAEAKSWSDVCVTSSNAVKIVRALPQANVLFVPDRHLGRYVASQVPEKNVILNDGYCPIHQDISANEVRALKAAHPDAPVLAHPECGPEAMALADFAGSTSQIIEAAVSGEALDYIILTVDGVRGELERQTAGTGKRFHFPATRPVCPDMDRITVERLVSCLRDGSGEVCLPPADVAEGARTALARMLELGAR